MKCWSTSLPGPRTVLNKKCRSTRLNILKKHQVNCYEVSAKSASSPPLLASLPIRLLLLLLDAVDKKSHIDFIQKINYQSWFQAKVTKKFQGRRRWLITAISFPAPFHPRREQHLVGAQALLHN